MAIAFDKPGWPFHPDGTSGLSLVGAIRKANREAQSAEFWDGLDEPTREGIPLRDWYSLPPSPTSEVIVNVRINGVDGTASVCLKDLPPGWTPGTVIEIDD